MQPSARAIAVAERVVVALLLGSTLVIAKGALNDVGPLTLAALRYCVAGLLFLPFLVRRSNGARRPRRLWLRFMVIGVSFSIIGNGALFVGLRCSSSADDSASYRSRVCSS